MGISKVTKEQMYKVIKALVYSFAAGFVGTLSLLAADFIQAAQAGSAGIMDLALALLAAAVVGGINAAIVYVKQLFTPNE